MRLLQVNCSFISFQFALMHVNYLRAKLRAITFLERALTHKHKDVVSGL